MVNEELLEKKIEESGYKKSFLAAKCGMTPTSFSAKCHNRSDFTTPEVKALCVYIKVSSLEEKEDIFFC